MASPNLDTEIRTQIDEFLVSISDLVRQAALQAVQEALGTSAASVASPARRGPGRPRKAAKSTTKAKASPGRKKAKGKPGRRARRSSADVEQVADLVLAYAKANAGHRLEEMGRGLKTDTADLKRPIQVLLAAGKLRTEGQKRGTKYFASKGGAAKPKASAKKAPSRKKARKTTRRKAAKRSKKAA